jgi:16S rRNA (guanine966-N2)-methyltransferase
MGTRPMLDRVKEALFSTLGMRIEDARVLDLFAGTGSLALEALSRGAASARLVESDRTALAALRTNVETLGLGERAEIVVGDALVSQSWGTERFDIIFFDPPYPLLSAPRSKFALLESLRALLRERLAADGVLVLHTPRGALQASEIAPDLGSRLREYGTNALWYLEALPAEPG